MKPHYLTSHDTVSNLDTAFNPSSPPHCTKDIPSNVSQVRTRSTTKKLRHCLENQTKDNIIFDLFVMVMKVNANKHL